jgi:hypothetical protein
LQSDNKIKAIWKTVKVKKLYIPQRKPINKDNDVINSPKLIADLFNTYFIMTAEKLSPKKKRQYST